MANKSTSWEYRIYLGFYEYNKGIPLHIQEGMSKKEAIQEAKLYIKNHFHSTMVVKIQTYDRNKIEVYNFVTNVRDKIIFSKKVVAL